MVSTTTISQISKMRKNEMILPVIVFLLRISTGTALEERWAIVWLDMCLSVVEVLFSILRSDMCHTVVVHIKI